jgi:acyl-CoA thioester hydrolase
MTPAGKLDSALVPTETTIGGSKALLIPMEVEFHDLDAMGHVNNVRYFTFMEAARVAFFRHFLDARRIHDLQMIAVEASCRFLSPVYWREVLLVQVWIPRVGNTSFDFQYEMTERDTGRKVARGKTVCVSWDYGTESKMRVPDPVRRLCAGGRVGG